MKVYKVKEAGPENPSSRTTKEEASKEPKAKSSGLLRVFSAALLVGGEHLSISLQSTVKLNHNILRWLAYLYFFLLKCALSIKADEEKGRRSLPSLSLRNVLCLQEPCLASRASPA